MIALVACVVTFKLTHEGVCCMRDIIMCNVLRYCIVICAECVISIVFVSIFFI